MADAFRADHSPEYVGHNDAMDTTIVYSFCTLVLFGTDVIRAFLQLGREFVQLLLIALVAVHSAESYMIHSWRRFGVVARHGKSFVAFSAR